MALLTGKSSNDDALLGKRAKTASGRLGTRMRGALTEAYESRGGGKSNLWLVYSPKADKDFVLRSDLEGFVAQMPRTQLVGSADE